MTYEEYKALRDNGYSSSDIASGNHKKQGSVSYDQYKKLRDQGYTSDDISSGRAMDYSSGPFVHWDASARRFSDWSRNKGNDWSKWDYQEADSYAKQLQKNADEAHEKMMELLQQGKGNGDPEYNSYKKYYSYFSDAAKSLSESNNTYRSNYLYDAGDGNYYTYDDVLRMEEDLSNEIAGMSSLGFRITGGSGSGGAGLPSFGIEYTGEGKKKREKQSELEAMQTWLGEQNKQKEQSSWYADNFKPGMDTGKFYENASATYEDLEGKKADLEKSKPNLYTSSKYAKVDELGNVYDYDYAAYNDDLEKWNKENAAFYAQYDQAKRDFTYASDPSFRFYSAIKDANVDSPEAKAVIEEGKRRDGVYADYDSTKTGAGTSGSLTFEQWFDAFARGMGGNSAAGTGAGAPITDINSNMYAAHEGSKHADLGTWSEDKLNAYYFLRGMGDDAGADRLAQLTNSAIAEAGIQKEIYEPLDKFQEVPVLGTAAATAAGVVVPMFTGIPEYLAYVDMYMVTGGDIDKNAMSLMPSNISSRMVGNAANQMNEWSGTLDNGIPVLGGKGAGDAYQLGISILQSALSRNIGGGMEAATLAQFFGSAASNGIFEGLNRGLDPNKALTLGTLNGFAEAIGEVVSLDKLVSIKSSAGARAVLKDVLVQMGIEGSEEAFTTVMNTLADIMVNADNSELEVAIQSYMSQGKSREEAEKQAVKDWINGVAFDFVGGALSGGISAGGANITRNIGTYKGSTKYLMDLAEQTPEGSKSREMLPNIQNEYTEKSQRKKPNRQNISAWHGNQFAQQVSDDLRASNRDAAVKAIENRLAEVGETGNLNQKAQVMADSLIDNMMGEEAGGWALTPSADFSANATANMKAVMNELAAARENFSAADYARQNEAWTDEVMKGRFLDTDVLYGDRYATANYQYGRAVERNLNEHLTQITDLETQISEAKKEMGRTSPTDTAKRRQLNEEIRTAENALKSHRNAILEDGYNSYSANQKSASVTIEGKEYKVSGLTMQNGGDAQVKLEGPDGSTQTMSIDDERLPAAFRSLALKVKTLGDAAVPAFQYYKPGTDISAYVNRIQNIRAFASENISKGAFMNSSVVKALGSEALAEFLYSHGQDIRKTAQAEISKKLSETKEAIKKAQKESKKKTGSTRGNVDTKSGIDIAGKHFDGIEGMDLSDTQQAVVRMIESLSDTLGIKYILFNGDARGVLGVYRKGGTIAININAGSYSNGKLVRSLAAETLSHELTHFIEQFAAEEYQALRDAVVEVAFNKNSELFNKRVQTALRNLPANTENANDAAMREVVADACTVMLKNSKMVTELARQNMTAAQKVADFIDQTVEKIRSTIEKAFSESAPQYYRDEAKLILDEMDRIQKLWDAGLKAATEAYNAQYQVSDRSTEAIAKDVEAGKEIKPSEEAQFSMARDEDFMDYAEKYNEDQLTKFGKKFVSADVMEKARLARQKIKQRMTQPGFSEKLKLPEDIMGNTFLGNSSYGGSEENTTVCVRSLAAQALMDYIAKEIGQPLTVEDTLLISQEMMTWINKPECVYCYVATDRRAYRQFLGDYIKQRDEALKSISDGTSKQDAYTEFLNGRKNTKEMRNRFKMWQDYAASGELISAADLASIDELFSEIDRLAKIENRTEVEESRYLQLKDAAKYAQSASWAKKMMGYTAYDGHILKWKQDRIDEFNKHYGLRMYSFSDFSPAFILENMQMVTDASVKGLKMLAYTKEMDFARIFAPSGMNINVSVFASQDPSHGGIMEDEMMGAKWSDAIELRKQYPNVGITLVATNDAIVEWGLNNPNVDVVIPYHLVRTGQDVADYFNYKNYTSVSADGKIKGVKYGKGAQKSVYPSEHQNDLIKYVDRLQELKLTPRFESYLKGYEQYIAGTITADQFREMNPTYMKLVNETRQSAENTPFVQPIFNEQAVLDSLQTLADEGGYDKSLLEHLSNNPDMAESILEEITDTVKDARAEREARRGEQLAEQPQVVEAGALDKGVQFQRAVTDEDTFELPDGTVVNTSEWLAKEEAAGRIIRTYKSFVQYEPGGPLYAPMATMTKDESGKYKRSHGLTLGQWEVSEGKLQNVNTDKLKTDRVTGRQYAEFELKKTPEEGGGTVPAAYNPYQHSSNVVLNDQFEAAYRRPELVTVECIIPTAELTSGYWAPYAKDPVGMHEWHKGIVASNLKGTDRQVYMTRWLKPVRVLSNAEVAQKYAEILEGEDVKIPFSVVPPGLLTELEKIAVPIDYEGSPQYRFNRAKYIPEAISVSFEETARQRLIDEGIVNKKTGLPTKDALDKETKRVRDEWMLNNWGPAYINGRINDDYTIRQQDQYQVASDKNYMDAVNSGNMEDAQRMVDEAAKNAGYTIRAFHGSPHTDISVFDINRAGENTGVYGDRAIWFTDSQSFADSMSYQQLEGSSAFRARRGNKGKVYDTYLRINKPFNLQKMTPKMRDLLWEMNLSKLRAMGMDPSQSSMGDRDSFFQMIDMALEAGNDQYVKFYVDYSMLQEAGYDGIVARLFTGNKNDNSVEYGVFSSEQIKSADPVTYDDDGKVIPLSQRFNDERPGIQYQMADRAADDTAFESEERTKAWTDLRAENEILRDATKKLNDELRKMGKQAQQTEARYARDTEKLASQRDKAKAQLKRTTTPETRLNDAKKLAREIVKMTQREAVTTRDKQHSKELVDDYAERIKGVADYIAQAGDNIDYDHVLELASDIAQDIVNNAEVEIDDGGATKEMREQMRAALKKRAIFVPQNVRADTLDWNDFKKQYKDVFTFKDNGLDIDIVYENLMKEIPGLLDPTINNPGDMLNEMAEKWDLLQARYENPFENYENETISHYMNMIIQSALDGTLRQVAPTYADRMNARISQLRAEKNQRIEEVRQQGIARKQEALAKERADKWERVEATRQYYQEMAARASQRRANGSTRTRIKKLIADLNTRLTHPTEKRYVPAELVKSTIDILDMIDLDSGRGGVKLAEKIALLQQQYAKLKSDPSFAKYSYDDVVAEKITKMAQVVGDTPLRNMSANQLETVLETLKMVEHMIRTAVNQKVHEENVNLYESGKNAIKATNGVSANSSKLLGNAADWYVSNTMRPDVVFERFGGFAKDSEWVKLYDMLNNAQRYGMDLQMKFAQPFESLLKDKDQVRKLTSAKEDDLVDIGLKDENGDAIKITRDFMLFVYMNLMNEDNIRHVMFGGITIPELKEYLAGKGDRGFGKGHRKAVGISIKLSEINDAINNATDATEKARLLEEKDRILQEGMEYIDRLRSNIESKLTDYDRKWVDAWWKFNEMASEAMNQTTMDVYGIKKFIVENYFPIITDKNYVDVPMETIMKDMSLENAGFSKERVHASTPIKMMGLADVVNMQANRTAQYAAMMPAVRAFNRIWNTTLPGYSSSLRDTVNSKFGSQGVKFIENLLTDLQGGRRGDFSIFDRLRGRMAQATLSLNPRVALAQTASFPSAVAELGWAPVMKALAKGGKKNQFISAADRELIAKWSSALWSRTKGATVDLADVKNMQQAQHKVMDKMGWAMNWIEFMDGATVGRLWYAAQYYVDDKYKDLKKGSDAYYEKVAEAFNRTIERTQPNYNALQRPELLRDPRGMVRALTMFMTQRLQNQSILYGSVMKYNKYKADLASGKNGVTQADVQEMRDRMVNAATSQLVAAFTIALFKALCDGLLHRWGKAYRDDDNELTAESVSLEVMDMFAESLVSNVLGGSEVYSAAKSIVTGDRYYGVELSGVSTFTDAIKDFVSLAQKPSLKAAKKLGQDFCMFMGIPEANAEKIGMALWNWGKDIATGDGFMESGVERTSAQNARMLIKAYESGDEKKIERFSGEFKDDDAKMDAVRQSIKDGYVAKKQTISKTEAVSLLVKAGMRQKDAEAKVQEWTCEIVTGIPFSKIKDEYMKGNITQTRVAELLQKYGGRDKDSAEKTARSYACEKDTGHPFNDLKDAYLEGEITRTELTSALRKYGLMNAGDSEMKATYYDYLKSMPDSKISEQRAVTYMQSIKNTGVSAKAYEDMVINVDADDSGGYSQKEVGGYIQNHSFTDAQISALWKAFGKTWKTDFWTWEVKTAADAAGTGKGANNGNVSQAELGYYLAEQIRSGKMTIEQAEKYWSSLLTTTKKTFSKWARSKRIKLS